MGGCSAEREISLRSGKAVAAGLREAGYDVTEVDIRHESLEDLPDGLEAVFIALHGKFGEDGGIQQLLEERGLPYTGSGPESSRISFDKLLSKELFLSHGLPMAESVIMEQVGPPPASLPLVIKPLREGSSIGVHLVFEASDWDGCLEEALSHGGAVMVERFIEGRELTVGYAAGEVLPVIEIRPPEGNYDFHAKYIGGCTEYIVPAEITDEQATRCQDIARKAFQVLNVRGLSRLDFRIDREGALYILENNSIPGFTQTSLLPKAAKAVGMSFSELCDRIMRSVIG
jgi:D-alanine-D-alanine ligase